MCVFSMVTEHYIDKLSPYVVPQIPPDFIQPFVEPIQLAFTLKTELTREEIDQFRRDMVEFKALLERARDYDRRNNQPDCELDSKRQMIKAIAAALGLDVSFV